MNKKRILLIAVLCFLGACANTKSLKVNHQSVHHEFGESVHEKEYEDTYVMNLIYPKTDIPTLDEEIQNIIQSYKSDFLAQPFVKSDDRYEFNVDYQSYIKDDRYISVKMDIFMNGTSQKEVIETLIYDQKKERFLAYDDVFDQDATAVISAMVQEKLKTQYPKECGSKAFAIHTAPAAHNFDQCLLF